MSKESERGNKFFAYLRRLRAGGRTNMYGAVPYLVQAFGIDRERAFQVVCEWLDLQAAEAALEPATPRGEPARPPRRAPQARGKKAVARRAA
jgi:hypothetical protein